MAARESNHFDGERYFNPSGANGQPFYRVPRLLLTARTPWPEHVPASQRRPPSIGPDAAVVTWIGHATFLIQTASGNLLIDPVYSERASPVSFAGPRRARPPAIAFGDLPRIDLVLLSHCHYDHCDVETLGRLAKRFDPVVVTPLGNAPLVRSAGIRRIEELDWGETSRGAPLGVTLTPAQHFSARTPFDRNVRLWGGFVVAIGGHRLYFAGDTGYGPHFVEVRRLGAIDVAMLPIGAYEPRWFMKDFHMNPSESVRAHLDLGAAISVAMHYGTFQLTPEGIDAPVRALEQARRERGVSPDAFRILEFGGSLRVGPRGRKEEERA